MYHIHAEQQGDAQAGVLYGQFLYVAYLGHSFQIEKPDVYKRQAEFIVTKLERETSNTKTINMNSH